MNFTIPNESNAGKTDRCRCPVSAAAASVPGPVAIRSATQVRPPRNTAGAVGRDSPRGIDHEQARTRSSCNSRRTEQRMRNPRHRWQPRLGTNLWFRWRQRRRLLIIERLGGPSALGVKRLGGQAPWGSSALGVKRLGGQVYFRCIYTQAPWGSRLGGQVYFRCIYTGRAFKPLPPAPRDRREMYAACLGTALTTVFALRVRGTLAIGTIGERYGRW